MRMTVKELDAYQVISEKYVKELNSEGIFWNTAYSAVRKSFR